MSKISFTQRCGTKVSGVVVQDLGHALLVRVETTNRKNLRGRTMLFSKNDMGSLKTCSYNVRVRTAAEVLDMLAPDDSMTPTN
jgi:hypothetical protein